MFVGARGLRPWIPVILLCAGFTIAVLQRLPTICVTVIPVRETAALRAILTIHSMQNYYRTQYGRFASSLTELGPPLKGAPGPAAADLIASDLATGLRQGYQFTMAAIADGYAIHANPVRYGKDGMTTFYSDHTGVIRENHGPEPATASSKERDRGGGRVAERAPEK